MGVIYKLKPEIKEYILEQKRSDPNFSCRKLPATVLEKFQVKLSKSTINTIIKEAGLSSAVGRKPKTGTSGCVPGSGVYLLKAMDSLAGGSRVLLDLLKDNIKSEPEELFKKVEFLLYFSLFGNVGDLVLNKESGIWSLINHKLNQVSISFFFSELQRIKNLSASALKIFNDSLARVCYLKVEFENQFVCFIDGEFHLAWSLNRIPGDFSAPLYCIDTYLYDNFNKDLPLSLFMSPGYEAPTKDFLDLARVFNNPEPKKIKITYYSEDSEEIKSNTFKLYKKNNLIFGLWPWQFIPNRIINNQENYRKIRIKSTGREYFVSPVEVKLSESDGPKDQGVIFEGYSLKQNLEDNVKVYILSNNSSGLNIVESYLSRWPNLAETLQDFSKKVEIYNSLVKTSEQGNNIKKENVQSSLDIYTAVNFYINELSNQFGHYFLPNAYKNADFKLLKERFYDLTVLIKNQEDTVFVTFTPTIDYEYLSDLKYACNRLNEAGICLANGKKLWFTVN